MSRHKRHRGGQPGNQNARTHGFYAAKLSIEQIREFADILNKGCTEPTFAILRIKLGYILNHTPVNRRLLREFTGLLYKWLISQDNYDRETKAEIRQFVRDSKAAIISKNNTLPEPIVSPNGKTVNYCRNESSLNDKITEIFAGTK
jgi:hypothetical protein